MDRFELKEAAKSQIKGKIGMLFLIELIIVLISFVCAVVFAIFIPNGDIVITIIITPGFALSLVRVYLRLTEEKGPAVGDAFDGFDDFWSAFKLSFLIEWFVFLWSLLFIVPGIIKAISYSMSMYILAENKGKPALECIRESGNLTYGHKMDLFMLLLSFIGWVLLCVVTFGIASIWVVPYMRKTYANAYQSLKPPVAPPMSSEDDE